MTFVPSYEIVGPRRDETAKTMLLVHGILGSGRNWRGFARDLLDEMPGWRAVLVDLRHHGESNPDDRSPSTVAQCARDLAALERALGSSFDLVAGHSFGGKVVLEYLGAGARPRRVVVLDSPPGAEVGQGAAARRILEDLRAVELPLPSRGDLVERMVAKGYSEGVARWMTTNLERVKDGGGYTWRFELDGVEALLHDYGSVDLWGVIEDQPGASIDVVRGERSEVWSDAELGRLEEAERAGRIAVHTLDAGHWVHYDDPEGVARVLRS